MFSIFTSNLHFFDQVTYLVGLIQENFNKIKLTHNFYYIIQLLKFFVKNNNFSTKHFEILSLVAKVFLKLFFGIN
ncbi:MAG: hypothetical protein COX39_00890 [Candidatus Nealsonbacteria bacterium CG23_combo_of_CG06-09_8_20_14_all_40_13]|uniref:Uncharacterized protein n=1 Tax=Candidatus Nealsonbacteria bacterium CG23_combo_of_CG06-09_8_20_14_all_40_13 TaxID=1974724 RepID=A0A2G9YRH1_9BACT|nr:MAG: hypothetical protein COX39_00890 [Candidatus Nealsonbacteria bacterium CG23_combo_of_CG06-09_8_20_14_all_40_13]PIR71225.1 MAG: hypothetical protein COU44_00780 [Candidatus Nealsonbacteria bacterium CG10_big_fil_rev_8_21_14_0_10_40_24]PIU43173.1 MAG: hypothetical protein COS97_02545 [Candidatus Nealsonbacteria bacterium CG07_land_8_20_14_0_80_40_10]